MYLDSLDRDTHWSLCAFCSAFTQNGKGGFSPPYHVDFFSLSFLRFSPLPSSDSLIWELFRSRITQNGWRNRHLSLVISVANFLITLFPWRNVFSYFFPSIAPIDVHEQLRIEKKKKKKIKGQEKNKRRKWKKEKNTMPYHLPVLAFFFSSPTRASSILPMIVNKTKTRIM